jgi:Phage integrase, N-terminal/Integrase
MHDLNHDLKLICRRNRDGSYATQADRERLLALIANALHKLGFTNLRATSLKPKHVERLVAAWKAAKVSAGATKNRMSALRWWAEKIGKANVVARSNDAYAIERRVFVTNVSKARELSSDDLAKVTDPHTRMSLRLQEAFGLRREESIKFQPAWADRGDRIVLKPSWAKGGKERAIPVRTLFQRQLLDEVKAFAGKGSLIPAGLKYVQQMKRFEYQCNRAGIHRVHGHRHLYAQQRYRDLTGRDCPACGGKSSKALTKIEKAADRAARLAISRELGHEREQVTAIYLGR